MEYNLTLNSWHQSNDGLREAEWFGAQFVTPMIFAKFWLITEKMETEVMWRKVNLKMILMCDEEDED